MCSELDELDAGVLTPGILIPLLITQQFTEKSKYNQHNRSFIPYRLYCLSLIESTCCTLNQYKKNMTDRIISAIRSENFFHSEKNYPILFSKIHLTSFSPDRSIFNLLQCIITGCCISTAGRLFDDTQWPKNAL